MIHPTRFTFVAFVFAAVAAAIFAAKPPASPLPGFTDAGSAAQRELEARFDAGLSAAEQLAWLEQMSSAPNHVGSPHDQLNAEFILAQFRAWGWDARIETFHVLYPTPKKVALALTAPNAFTARLREPAVTGDRTSSQIADELPPYNVYGADGDVTAELVYVNQGMPDDYKELARHGVDVRGRIVIARYGGGWRGLKPKLAHAHGAVGCIIYSDPKDDGFGAGDAYPKGGFRPADGVQRGSVLDMPIYPGDPLTPGVGATAEANRLSIPDAKTILKIPVLPISYADAQPLLAALAGEVAPATWRGALPITYHIGPGPAKVHLTITSEWTQKPIRDVIAMLPGSERPDEWVMRGNHFDGWVFGAEDPLSGCVALLAEAKAIGALAKTGWRPKRTLVYAAWDGEEPGLLGSTEWVEAHADELRQKMVLYVNTDGNGRGFFAASGSHGFQSHVNAAIAAVTDPETKATALERRRAKLLVDGTRAGATDEAKRIAKLVLAGGQPPLGPIGSGSDYTAFIDHLGVASLNVSFDGEDDTAGIYHSAYDSYDHYTRFGDPGLRYGVALAQTAGRLALRTANADLLPLRCADFADTVAQYGEELHKLADAMRESTETQHRLLDDKSYVLAADPTKKSASPERDAAVPVLNFAPLDNAMARLKKVARASDEARSAALRGEAALSAEQGKQVDAVLRTLELALVDERGLPGREWFRHMIYAPGLETGYGAKTLPGIREAIEGRRWAEAEHYVVIVAAALMRYADRAEAAAALLKPAEIVSAVRE